MAIKLGIAPIAWSNDDLPELGGKTPLEVCLSESRQAGFSGTELGGKFPRNPEMLKNILEKHELQLASGWFSGGLLTHSVEEEKKRIDQQLKLFKALGCTVMVYAECTGTIQNKKDTPLSQRSVIAKEEFSEYGRKLTELAEYLADKGVPMAYHHHMGTVIETQEDIDRLMENTGPAVGLTLDTGHLTFAGGDVERTVRRYAERIRHVHCKDVRAEVLAQVKQNDPSFLDTVLSGVFTVPGDGMIDYKQFAKLLAEIGYEGWVVVEAEQDPAKANPLEYARKGYKELIESFSMAGFTIEG